LKLSIYEEIEDNLISSQKAFKAYEFVDDEKDLRSLSESKQILKTLKNIAQLSKEMIEEYPSLDQLFIKVYGEIKFLFDRESILEICFLEDYLFPEKEQMPLPAGAELDPELLENYQISFREWVEETKLNHINSQAQIKEGFDPELKSKDLLCQCQKCIADYRAKLRDSVFSEQKNIINESIEDLHELIIEKDINYIANYINKMKKKIDRNLQVVKYRLKRGSLNKLDKDIKSYLKQCLGGQSELGRTYEERIKARLISSLAERDISPEMITDEEFERFFLQLGLGIWKRENVLLREFEKLTNSVMAFKRKDISANILREYLGKFWVYAEARKKKRKVIYHMGPTNSGKTYNAIEALAKAKHGCYLAPLRLLASELFDTLNEKGAVTTLLTGEEVIEQPGATHFSSTIEMAKMNDEFDCVVIDEIQMITDTQRGWAWTRALVNINADEIHLCGDGSVFELVEKILELTGDTLEVRNYERKTSLSVMNQPIKLVDLDKGDALIVFSRRNALKYKMDLERLGFKVSIVYGRLSPEVRREQARKFDEGETDIMVSTDAIAMGMNLPIKRVVFSTLSKFFDSKEHPINDSEIKQIAGRAGRYGRYPEGFVTCLQQVEDGLDRVRAALGVVLDQKKFAMVGPDLEIFRSVNHALEEHSLRTLDLSEFLRLFNTMTFEKPFYCVDLKEMIEVTEMIEEVDEEKVLSDAETFGFACAPVNLGLMEHVQYYVWIASHYVKEMNIINEEVDANSDDIDYLERAIKCVELYQWLARHFQNKNFHFSEVELLQNKSEAIEKLNQLLSEKTSKKCSSCGCKLPDDFDFNICETCFNQRRFTRRGGHKDFKGKSGGDRGGKGRGGKPKKGGKGKSSGKSTPPKSKGSRKKSRGKKNKAAAFKRG
jgi:ATP-dependent RNA helicase SUPV3L1/SUV3